MTIMDYFYEHNTLEVFIRLLLAMISGMCIGIDRGVKRRGAGVKTHSLVGLGAALVMLTGEYIYMNFNQTGDVARLGAQVISGIGFLGVGTIIVTGRNQVRGLTTAAGLWACACIGLAYGIGFYDGATIMFILAVFTLKVMTKLDVFVYKHSKILDLYIGFYNLRDVNKFMHKIREAGIKMTYFEVNKEALKEEGPTATLTIEIGKKYMREEVLSMFHDMDEVSFVEEL